MSKIQKFRICWWAVFSSLMIVLFTSITVWTYYLEAMLTSDSSPLKDALAWTAGGLVFVYIVYLMIVGYRFKKTVSKDPKLIAIRNYLIFKKQKFDESQEKAQLDLGGLEKIWKNIKRDAWVLGFFVMIFGTFMVISQLL
ncbi:hypothetical protein [Mycoplasma sp. ATU-Cv-508]|uniref:hypothetical protein n=1 Tax=Mycoplasma sp. ATU-Cv-508 TaxID=2048001 RepID=UPI000FDF5639